MPSLTSVVKSDDIRRQPLSRPVMASAGSNGSEVYLRGRFSVKTVFKRVRSWNSGPNLPALNLVKYPPGWGLQKSFYCLLVRKNLKLANENVKWRSTSKNVNERRGEGLSWFLHPQRRNNNLKSRKSVCDRRQFLAEFRQCFNSRLTRLLGTRSLMCKKIL